jgi:hypothetical protein
MNGKELKKTKEFLKLISKELKLSENYIIIYECEKNAKKLGFILI